MKRIRLYAIIVGLLTCAVVASAQKLTVTDANGQPVSGTATAGGRTVDFTNGTLDLAPLGLGNITNKTIKVVVQQCHGEPPLVVFVLPGETPPQPPSNCDQKDVATAIWGGVSWTITLAPGTPFTLQAGPTTAPPTPASAPSEGGGFFTPNLAFTAAGGAAEARNLGDNIGGANTEAVQMFFGPFSLETGFTAVTAITNSQTSPIAGSIPGQTIGTLTTTTTANVRAIDAGGGVSAFDGGGPHDTCINVKFNGGLDVTTARVTMSQSTSLFPTTGGSTPGVRPAVATVSTRAADPPVGSVGHYWGVTLALLTNKHVGPIFSYRRLILPHGSTSQTVDLFEGGVIVFVDKPKALVKVHHKNK